MQGKICRIAWSPGCSAIPMTPAAITWQSPSQYAHCKRGKEQVWRDAVVPSIRTTGSMKECNHKHLQPWECRTLARVTINTVVRLFQRLFLAYEKKVSKSSKMISRNLERKYDSFEKISQKFLISQILGSSRGQGILKRKNPSILSPINIRKINPQATEETFKTL